jgi:hypothetical protein
MGIQVNFFHPPVIFLRQANFGKEPPQIRQKLAQLTLYKGFVRTNF